MFFYSQYVFVQQCIYQHIVVKVVGLGEALIVWLSSYHQSEHTTILLSSLPFHCRLMDVGMVP